MTDFTIQALQARRLCGDRVALDWAELMQESRSEPGRTVYVARLRNLWNCSQPTVSRRLAAINAAPPEAGLGRVERVQGAHGRWRVVPRREAP